MLTKHIKPPKECQLRDKSKTGCVRPWSEKKISNLLLSQAYEQINLDKVVRLKDCASYLVFKKFGDGQPMKLESAHFCKVRLCPLCAFRRSLKIFSHTNRILRGMESENHYAYLFLTLTLRNCSQEELITTIDLMMDGFSYLVHYKPFKDAVLGWYRGMEVTHNVNPKSESYDTYHPHFHCILAVDKNYFKDKRYIPHDEWVALWRKAARLDYDPNVDIRRVKGNTVKAVTEATKYTVKEADYILPNDWGLTVETVRVLDNALANRRLVAYGGTMKVWHKRLNLDDEVDGDLINTQDELETAEDIGYELVRYTWNVGYSQYLLDKD